MSNFRQTHLLIFFLFFGKIILFAQKDTVRSIDPAADLYKSGIKKMDSLRFKEALQIFQKALKKNSQMTECYNKMAFCKMKLNDFEGASEDLQKSLQLQPDNYECIKYLGRSYFFDKKYNEAKRTYDEALKLNPNDFELLFFVAELKAVGRDLKGAIDLFTACINEKENYAEAYFQRAFLKFDLEDFNYSIKDITDGFRYRKDTAFYLEAQECRAKARFQVGDFKGCAEDYSKILERSPKHENSLTFRGAARIYLNDNSGAIDDLSKAIEINKKSYVAFNFRGVAKGGNKQYVEALKDLDQAIKIKFNYASAYVNRASIKMASRDKKGACADLEKADQLGSDVAYKLIQKYCSNSR